MKQYRVTKLGQRGDGIVGVDDGTLHVAKVLPGEMIELRDGALFRVASPSPERVPPFCIHYDTCGGCKFQHWQEAPYRAWKRDLLVATLAAHGLDATVGPMIDAHGDGRRRVSLHVREINGQWQAGFMEQKSHDLVAIDTCPVLVPALAVAARIAASFGPMLGPCDVAITAADNGLDVSIRAERKAVDRRMTGFVDLMQRWKLLRLSINGEVVASHGQPEVHFGIVAVPLPVQSFLQATVLGEATLTALVLDAFPKVKHVLDLFGGVGTFTLPLAKTTRVTSVDSDRQAIDSLQKAVKAAQGLKPVTAIVRNLFNAPYTFMELRDFDAVVLDPPRAGAEAQVKMLAKSKISHVAYVSCDMQSFARDAKILVKSGFALKQVTPVDQFKWTVHLEMVGVFTR